jgi:hypothetical protein
LLISRAFKNTTRFGEIFMQKPFSFYMAGNDPGCSDVIPPAFVLLKTLFSTF